MPLNENHDKYKRGGGRREAPETLAFPQELTHISPVKFMVSGEIPENKLVSRTSACKEGLKQ